MKHLSNRKTESKKPSKMIHIGTTTKSRHQSLRRVGGADVRGRFLAGEDTCSQRKQTLRQQKLAEDTTNATNAANGSGAFLTLGVSPNAVDVSKSGAAPWPLCRTFPRDFSRVGASVRVCASTCSASHPSAGTGPGAGPKTWWEK